MSGNNGFFVILKAVAALFFCTEGVGKLWVMGNG